MEKIDENIHKLFEMDKNSVYLQNSQVDDLSFSIYVDSKNHMKHHRRKIKKWVSDDSVTNCKKCDVLFTIWYRKHHCRICGRIFCYYCSNNYVTIPNEMWNDIPVCDGIGLNDCEVRVCNQCNIDVDEFNGFYEFVKSRICDFDMIKIKAIANLKSSNSDNNDKTDSDITKKIKAATYCLNKLREIQYKLPTEKISEIEKDLLLTNQKYLRGHSKWDIQYLKFCNKELIDIDTDTDTNVSGEDKVNTRLIINKGKRRFSCWDTMCTRQCFDKIQLSEIIDVLVSNNKLDIDNILSECLKRSTVNEITLFLPVLSDYLPDKHLYMLLETYKTNSVFLSELYLSIKLYRFSDNQSILADILKKCPIIEKIHKLYDTISNTHITAGNFDDLISPIHPKEKVSIDKSKIVTINSASKPLLIPLKTDTGLTRQIIYKMEDVRKDHIVSNLISFSCLKLKQAGIPVEAITYKVSPISTTSGIIEIVDNSTTIYNITQNMGFTVQNYINEYNPKCTTNDIINRFMRSTSLYCIISYLLGFGDRHLDNIMISKAGLLFHIDFSYILGKDPKYNNSKHIKLTPEIINVIGGYNSRNYTVFKKYCIEIYNELRLHINAFMNMLLLVAKIDSSIDEKYIKNHLLTRFEAGETSLEAALHMGTKISVNKGYNIADKVVDMLYKSKRVITGN